MRDTVAVLCVVVQFQKHIDLAAALWTFCGVFLERGHTVTTVHMATLGDRRSFVGLETQCTGFHVRDGRFHARASGRVKIERGHNIVQRRGVDVDLGAVAMQRNTVGVHAHLFKIAYHLADFALVETPFAQLFADFQLK